LISVVGLPSTSFSVVLQFGNPEQPQKGPILPTKGRSGDLQLGQAWIGLFSVGGALLLIVGTNVINESWVGDIPI